MKRSLHLAVGLCALMLFLLSGCTKSYIITYDLEMPLEYMPTYAIGEITDELPLDMEEGKKPSMDDIRKLKGYLHEELAKRKHLDLAPVEYADATYELVGSVIEYKKGSGVVRALIGFGLGSSYATITLKLVDIETNEVVFGGNFKGSVTDWKKSGDEMFKKISKNFAKELEKQYKKLN